MSIAIQSGMRLTPARLNRLIPLVARKTSTQTVNNSITLVTDTALSVAVEANGLYRAHLHLIYNSNTTADFRYSFSAPSGSTLTNFTAQGGNTANWQVLVAPAGGVSGINGTGGDAPLNVWGIVAVGANAGNVAVQWAQFVANASDTTVKAGSYLELVRYS